MPIILKSKHQIMKLRSAGRLVAETVEMLREHIQPGVKTAELDRRAEEFIRTHGATPSYKGYRGSNRRASPFPGTICASVNEVICHGIPSSQRLKEGDIIGVDVGVFLDGWCGDICVTFPVGKIDARSQQLLDVTEESLKRGIAAAGPDRRVGDIGAAIQTYVEPQGFSIVREYIGHGIGQVPHESEPIIHHFGKPNTGPRLCAGMVFTIEPMINMGRPTTKLLSDGWTVVTADGLRSAQFEHTIAITDTGVEILSLL